MQRETKRVSRGRKALGEEYKVDLVCQNVPKTGVFLAVVSGRKGTRASYARGSFLLGFEWAKMKGVRMMEERCPGNLQLVVNRASEIATEWNTQNAG